MQPGDCNASVEMTQSREPFLTSRRLYRINRRDISFLRFILEGYDGLALLTTQDAARGIVSVAMAPGCEDLVEQVIATLATDGEIYIEPLAADMGLNNDQGSQCPSST